MLFKYWKMKSVLAFSVLVQTLSLILSNISLFLKLQLCRELPYIIMYVDLISKLIKNYFTLYDVTYIFMDNCLRMICIISCTEKPYLQL